MGKDKNGTFFPPKGKPSGEGKEKGVIVPSIDPDAMEQYQEIEEKYIESENETGANVYVRHQNRNVDKKESHHARNAKRESNKSRNDTLTEEFSSVSPEEITGVLTKEIFTELANYKSTCCVSIYFPQPTT